MTNYGSWDKKAEELCRQAEEEDDKAKKACDEALGLTEGPQGPPTAKAKQMRQEMAEHSEDRKNFIAQQEGKEKVITHADPSDVEIVLSEQDEGLNARAVRLRGSRGVSYRLTASLELLKLYVEECRDVKIRVGCKITTCFMEVARCSDVEINCESNLQMVQCDECNEGCVAITFTEPEVVADFFHQNCPSLEVRTPGRPPFKFGSDTPVQMCSKHLPSGEYATEAVVRGEKDFPMQLGMKSGKSLEPEAERPPTDEARRQEAEAKREEGNRAFRSSDFLQAAVHYTEAINLCSDLPLAYANRAQCFLRTGDPDRALKDATKCTELEPGYAKGWFRKGMAYHAMERYGMAIPALLEAEKLDPKNPQIQDAIKMAQLMCRKKGPGEME